MSRILLVASADGVTFDRVSALRILLYDAALGDAEPLAYFDIKPETGEETALICGELYRRGEGWKFRALGEGYSNGLQGLAVGLRHLGGRVRGRGRRVGVRAARPARRRAAAAARAARGCPRSPQQPRTATHRPPRAREPTRQQPPAAQPAYGYPQPTSQPAYGYPQPAPAQPATAAAQSGYGYPQPVAALPDPDFRLPPQGPQFIGR